jgi:hypothetical protein
VKARPLKDGFPAIHAIEFAGVTLGAVFLRSGIDHAAFLAGVMDGRLGAIGHCTTTQFENWCGNIGSAGTFFTTIE